MKSNTKPFLVLAGLLAGLSMTAGTQAAMDVSELRTFAPGIISITVPVLHENRLYGINYAGGGEGNYSTDTAGQDYQLYAPPSLIHNADAGRLLLANGRFYQAIAGDPSQADVLGGLLCATSYTLCYGGVLAFTPGQTENPLPLPAGDNRIYQPSGAITADAEGNIYFTDTGNGSGAAGNGTLWKLNLDDTLDAVSTFATVNKTADLLVDGDYIYGLNALGGDNGLGTLYRVRPDGTDFSVLHHFTAAQGQPGGDLYARSALLKADDFIYGTTTDWQASGTYGAFFRIRPDGSEFELLHVFTAGNEGANPAGALALDGQGDIYGTTLTGGTENAGTVYRIRPANAGTAEPVFELQASFNGSTTKRPLGLIHDAAGDALYGTTKGDAAGGAQLFTLAEIIPFRVTLTRQIMTPSGDPSSLSSVGIGSGFYAVLNWTAQGAAEDASCEAKGYLDGAWTDSTAVAGSAELHFVRGDEGTHTFWLECLSDGELFVTEEVEMEVRPQSQVGIASFQASASTLAETFTVSWAVSNRRSETVCTGSSTNNLGWEGVMPLGSSPMTVPVPNNTGTVTYELTITCTTPDDDDPRATGTASTMLTIIHGAPDGAPNETSSSSGGGAISPALLLLLMLTGMARYAARTPRRQRG